MKREELKAKLVEAGVAETISWLKMVLKSIP